ncbi:LytR/AlgR family response regulator transcription factor [Flavobacterium aquidurense]|jgi:two-component system LytT family response regulator|uniref:LytR/AlgR family response regulator transcription factor n=1 Tax=Flavobacterium aquidurense TaxID=362413 RepID=UPI0009105F13|nr:response regulator transcription factor [Flavobacterium aquidurense]OXA73696.1 DNA-binding response regulator [Flavobacterium aquidurense]SHG77762.1 two component transcriptional regulator, LytTR family [Flavobacterium frigidimaris]
MALTYRCLIIDDESPAHKALTSHISKFDDLEHSGSAFSGMEAVKMLNENTYDIIFLDINMPVISGVELMELQPKRPLTIITTAYSDFALSAYQNDAIDYLLKPISFEKFSKAIEKAKIYYSGNNIKKENKIGEKTLSQRVNGQMTEMLVSDIIYIESLGNYMKLYSKKLKSPMIIYGSLSSISDEIDSTDFLQVHRSFIVNTREINSVTFRSLTMSNREIIPVGRKYQILLDNLMIR